MLKCGIALVCIMLGISAYAGKGLDQLYAYKNLEELGVEFSGPAVELGSNLFVRCKSDPILLDEMCTIFQDAAAKGNNVPALMLGKYMHDFAPLKGERFLLDLAERGDTDAMSLLAVLYYDRDEESALKWLRKAAETGDQDALQVLIADYENSIPESEFLLYVRELVDKNDEGALIQLAIINMREGNLIVAEELLTRVWRAGVKEAALIIAHLYKERDQNTELSWMRKGADAGHSDAQFELANILLDGTRSKQDEQKGLHWLKLSAESGNVFAQIKLGQMYYEGRMVEKDMAIAMKWDKMAAEQGNAQAQYNVGALYLAKDNLVAAYPWYWKASQQGYSNALEAVRYIEETLSDEDLNKARKDASGQSRNQIK